jgi:hypothetical protein
VLTEPHPAALDLGHLKWNLVLDSGLQLADRFLACYQTTTGISSTNQPVWDLVSLFDLLLDGDKADPAISTPKTSNASPDTSRR